MQQKVVLLMKIRFALTMEADTGHEDNALWRISGKRVETPKVKELVSNKKINKREYGYS